MNAMCPILEGGPPGVWSQNEMLVVTQQMLQDYLELQLAVERRERLRHRLIDLLQGAAAVEPGQLRALLRLCERRCLNGANLVPLLGAARVDELKALVKPAQQTHLIVGPA